MRNERLGWGWFSFVVSSAGKMESSWGMGPGVFCLRSETACWGVIVMFRSGGVGMLVFGDGEWGGF